MTWFWIIGFYVIGNLITTTVQNHRAVPPWSIAPTHEKLLRLAWPTAIIVYMQYPKLDQAE
jgi:hypothetical protein